MTVYPPSEDSFLLASEVKNYISSLKDKKIKILDMGSGSGIQALAAIASGIKKENILCADIQPEAITYLKKQGLKALHSDLFSKIPKSHNFNLIVFNAPYLPENKYDKKPDTTAGKRGNEVIIRFLKEAKQHLKEKGIILLLFSSLSRPEEILKEAKKLKYQVEKLTEENIGMMEVLYVYKFSKN